MSPNEFQLRAALHEGEGDALDIDEVVAGAVRVRRERRRRVSAVAAAAVVVAFVGIGGVTVLGGGDGAVDSDSAPPGALQAPPHAASTATAGQGRLPGYASPAEGAAPAAPAAPARPSEADKAAAFPACPPALYTQARGGDGRDDFGAGGPLFATPVLAMRVCGYAPDARLTGSKTLTGQPAADAAAQLDSKRRSLPNCGSTTPYDGRQVTILAVGPGDKSLRPVSVAFECPYTITNGTAVRTGAPIPDVLAEVVPQASPAPNEGSPPR